MRKPRHHWTDERIREEALKHSTRTAFRKASPAYKAAHRKGVIDAVCEHMLTHSEVKTKWSIEDLHAVAAEYRTRYEFQQGNGAAYKCVQARGLLDVVCAHMPKNARLVWTEEAIRQEAAKYTKRGAFGKGPAAGAYNRARQLGIEDEVFAHMDDNLFVCDNDTVYIWKAPGEYFNGKPVYKLGVTSAARGDTRIREVNKDAEIVVLQPVTGKATDHEAILHILGDDPQYTTGDGRTEFRALSDSELNEAIQYIEEVAA